MLPFLFIHGAGGTKSKWRFVRERLPESDGLYIDLPGHGVETGAAKESIRAYAEALSEQIHQDVVIVGHSMGGLIGIELAARNPHVKGLIMVASHYRLPVHEKILSRLRDGEFPNSLFNASYRKNADRKLIEDERTEITLVSTEITLSDYECCNRYDDGKATLSKLTLPVHVLYGSEDKLLPPLSKDEMLAANSRVRTWVIPSAAHYVMLERPDETVSYIRSIRDEIQ
ncbi:alpha/beta fold hydrolase [Alicyclobacillus sp. SO9]|uniref:alpha/beta fold hydrolase n=1 Tax=Alicyclobacillus sp. SO9 TaxID=2665646 RepID=UPI0018E73D45|nr:alpha/beta hydrolase [Alicyclobacillus sp. SO9]QQE77582.1 alpha/beta hydrolase [Alicyclobacillus sp. SO9]